MKGIIKQQVKRYLIALIGPYIIPIVAILGIAFAVLLIAGLLFAQLTAGPSITGFNPSDKDTQIKAWVSDAVNKYSASETYLDGQNVHKYLDAYGRDRELGLTFGQVYSIALYQNSVSGTEITKQLIDGIAEDIHPVFYYKAFTRHDEYLRKVKDKDGNEKDEWVKQDTTQYFLVRAETLTGSFTYTYKEVKEQTANHKADYFIPDSTVLNGSPYEKLDEYVKTHFNSKDVETDRRMLLASIQGFDTQTEQLEWLDSNVSDMSGVVSGGTVPAELVKDINDVSKKYGIPVWFIEAVIQQESSFRVTAVNSSTGALGLMQVMPDNWKHYAPLLGYDANADMFNPKAQLDVGTYLLKSYLGNIDWTGDWKEQTLKGLAQYGGFSGYDALDRCRFQYASKVWAYAEGFKSSSSVLWPLPGYYDISSPFGLRIQPITGKQEYHEGIDIPAPEGTPIHAAVSGVVVVAGWVQGYGNTVVIRDAVHDYLYGHQSRIAVHVGDIVKTGDVVGYVGSTGNSTGPHLHFGISIGNWANGNWIDPMSILER